MKVIKIQNWNENKKDFDKKVNKKETRSRMSYLIGVYCPINSNKKKNDNSRNKTAKNSKKMENIF